MYFNSERSDTNIDKELNHKNSNKHKNTRLSHILLNLINNKKNLLIVGIIIVLLLVMIVLFINRKPTIYLELIGDEVITLYQGSDYIEPGYKASNSKKEDLNQNVIVATNLNIDKVGNYEVTYTIDDIVKTRKINIIAKSKEYTYIYLNTVNNNVNIYLKAGDTYEEPGYQVFNSYGLDLNDKVEITGTVDTSKKGSYVLTYSVYDSSNVKMSVTRTIVVMDSEINLTLNNQSYTNEKVTINIGVIDEFFDYIILPNNVKVTETVYTYEVSENGNYTFTTYNKKGMSKQASIEVKNIDKMSPNGTCEIDQNQKGSFISIKAKDSSGIKKYVYNGQSYTTSTINLTSFTKDAKVIVYDNANNYKEITCTVVPRVYISNIKKDGVIITVNAKKVNNDIKGYYFSYTNKRPNKDSGGYIETNKETIDVVRLTGTTYVWVEDKVGKISDPQSVTITNDAILMTDKSGYTILENMTLSKYLSNKGWSIEELNNLIARSVRAAGLYTKEAAATSAVAFQTVLAQKYKIKLPYWNGGKSYQFGADPTWGTYKKHYADHLDAWFYYYGLDCSGFTTWAYVNAGYNVKSTPNVSIYPAYWWGYKYTSFSKENGEIGDFLISDGHIKLIIGKTNTAFLTAEARGTAAGMVVSTHPYTQTKGYRIQKGEELMKTYNKYSRLEIPTGV